MGRIDRLLMSRPDHCLDLTKVSHVERLGVKNVDVGQCLVKVDRPLLVEESEYGFCEETKTKMESGEEKKKSWKRKSACLEDLKCLDKGHEVVLLPTMMDC